jgi:hypothetical protein
MSQTKAQLVGGVGISTAQNVVVGSAVTINSTGINVVGIVTATSFVGNGSGLTGAGSTVADITANATYYPLFTQTVSGTVTASGISTAKLTYNPSSGTLTATNFSASSDYSLKENIETIQNAINSINNLRGVKYNWKEDGTTSYGLIAQELENVFPELVSTGDIKTVNYNGIIAVLIEAVKELSTEIDQLKKKN